MVLESNTLDVLFVKDGQQGEDGKILYTWIKYAKDANGTGITDDPNGAIYIGISYNNESSIESNDPTHYAWTKIQGVDGKKGEDAYTIFLENENISFATDENRNPLSEQAYTSGITIMKGEKPVTDFTIGDIAKTQGIAVAKTDTAIAISVINGNPLPSDSGEIEIPITVGGTAFKKILTWTCAKKGDQGEKGEQGIQGPQGEQGIAGKDGTSVTITNKSITYQLSTSGTTIPTGTWQTTPQAIPEGQYQWTKTSVTYSDGNKTESYSISYHGKNGSDGTSVKTTSTSVKYQVGDSGTTKPTGTWQSNVPTVAQGKYLWTQTIVNYSDGNSTESYSVSYRGIDGSNGVNGMNAATIYLYQRATSTPSKPSNTLTYTFSTTTITGTLNNGWSTAIPTGTDAVYVTVASVSSKNDTATIATSAWSAPVVLAQNGKTGSDGKAGLNVATIYLYQRNTSKPSKPSASVTYTFSTGVASGLNNGWSQKIPDGTNPLYVTLATASSNTATDTILSSEWSDVVVMAQNGEDGQDGISPKVTLSKSGDTTTISIVDATGTHTQTVKDGTNGTPGAAGKDGKTSYFHVKYSNDGGKTFTGNSGEDTGIYMGSYTDYTEADSTDVSKYTWVKVKGDKGDTGQKGDNAKNLTITPSSQYFKSTDGGKTFAPNVITIKPTIQGEINFGKWQFSIDGGVSFTDVVSGQKGLTINNNVLTVSKDSSLYSDAVTMVTFRAVANDSSFYDTCSIAKIYDVSDIEIGGRNLLLNSDKEYVMGFGIPNTTWTDGYAYIGLPTTRINDEILPQNNAFLLHPEAGKTYTQTIWIETDADVIDLNAAQVSWFTGKYGHVLVAAKIIKLADNSYKLTSTHTVTKEDSDIRLFDIMFLFSALDISNSGTYLKFGKLKVEQGNVSTDWTPAIEDVQTAILSTKSEISDVSLKVDKNKQAIEQRVEKTTYQQDLNLVKGDISKANEGLNKWRYEIYPKSLFASEYQGKSTMGVFAKNTNLTPSQSVLINDTDFGKSWAYGDNYIGYALTFVKFSAAKSIAITFKHDDGAHLYLNGKLIGGDDTCNIGSGESLTLSFIQGWNCLEVVLNEKSGGEYIGLGTTISAISECQLMNCYYGTPVARQSHITNQLVQNTTDIDGVSGSVQKVMSTVGGSGKIDEFVNNYSTWKKKVDGIETRVGETYTTKSDFNGLEIGGRNLLTKDDCNMSKWQNLYPAHCKVTNNDYSNHIDYVPTGGEWEIIYKKISVTKGQKYILSFDYKVNKAYNYLSGQKYGVYLSTSVPTNAAPTNIITDGQYAIENTVTSIKRGVITFTAPIDTLYIAINGGCIDDNQTGLSFEFNKWKLEKGNKATDWTPASEDDEINGQNLVSNLPANWEQGTVTEGSATGTTYASTKSPSAGSIRPKELIPVSGNITISTAYSNQSKKPIRHWIAAYDVNKNYLGNNYVPNAWNSFPRTLNMKDAKYIAIMVGYTDSSAITPSDISQICLKIERGTSATPFTLAPEDVNGKIVNVETIANQTAKKFEWIVKGGDSSSNFTLTDRVADLVADRINFNGLVKFSGLNTDAKNEIGKVAQSKVDGLDVGGRNLALQSKDFTSGEQYWSINSNFTRSVDSDGFTVLSIKRSGAGLEWNRAIPHNYIPVDEMHRGIIVSFDFMCDKVSELDRGCICALQIFNSGGGRIGWYESQDILSGAQCKLSAPLSDGKWIRVQIPFSEGDLKVTYGNSDAVAYTSVSFNLVANGSIHFKKIKIEYGNKATDWTPAPEDYLPQVDLVSNWTTNTTWIDGGKIYTNSITADKIATDAIKSRNYISSGGTQGSFLNLSDGSFQSPNLSWDSNGNLIAKNANIIGNLTAGTVGEWKIDKYIYSRDKMFFDINKHNGQSIYNKNSTNNLFLGDGKVSSFYWFTTQNNTFIIENGNSPQYATGPAGISFGTNIAQGQIELYESVYPGNIIQDYEQTSHTSELSISGAKISFSYYDSNGSSFSDSPYTYIMADYARFYGDIFVQGSITTDEGVDVGGKLQASSIATKNGGLIETAGTVYGGGEIQCGGGQMRIIGGNYGILLRNDGSDFYILSTDSGSPWGSWNSKRPFRINLANGIPYFEYGIIIPNENYLLGNGYQLARGTSWGGVCIGDDSKGLRLYGTSIWASHSISTSDENLKENFTTLDQYEDFYMNLNPIGFNYIGDYDGKKTHFGFGAHKTEDILESEGYDADKFAVVTHRPLVQEDIEKRFGKDVTVDIETEYGVSYAEFIALNTHMIQKTRRELTKVKQEKADLEARLQIIEAKLGL